MPPPESREPLGTNTDHLNGWKEIAAYVGKSVRSVQRWERAYRLPIRRIQAASGEVIFASRREIDAWKLSDAAPGPAGEPEAPEPEHADAIVPAPPTIADPPREKVSRARRAAIMAAVGVAIVLMVTYGALSLRRSPTISAAPPFTRPQGQTFQLTGQGFTPSGGVTRWTAVPNGNEEPMSAALIADGQGGVRWALSTDCRTETGTHRLWMVDDRTGRTAAPVSLVVLRNPECDKPAADLVARSVDLDRSSARPGDQVGVTFSIWNLGTAPAPATTTRLRLGSQSTRTGPGDRALGDHPTSVIAVGDSRLERLTIAIPRDIGPGVYYVWIVADNRGAIIERDSHNNFARSEALSIQAR